MPGYLKLSPGNSENWDLREKNTPLYNLQRYLAINSHYLSFSVICKHTTEQNIFPVTILITSILFQQ